MKYTTFEIVEIWWNQKPFFFKSGQIDLNNDVVGSP